MTKGKHLNLQNFNDRYYELFTLTTECVTLADIHLTLIFIRG